MAENTVQYQGTGRRKNAVARVRLVPGTGQVTVNKRDTRSRVTSAVRTCWTRPWPRSRSRTPLVPSTLSPCAMAAAFPVRLALCASASPAPFSRPATTVLTSRRLVSSLATPAWSSARSTASRRPVVVRSSPSAKRRCESRIFACQRTRPRGGFFFCDGAVCRRARGVRSGRGRAMLPFVSMPLPVCRSRGIPGRMPAGARRRWTF